MNPGPSTPSASTASRADEVRILRRLRWLTGLFIVGLFLSGATAIPLETELGWLVNATNARGRLDAAPAGPAASASASAGPAWAVWMCRVQDALKEVNERHPFIAYGGDWLAFGHFMIALAFVWAWRDPVRHRWLFDYGLIACALVIPYAFIFGGLRGIPLWWRLIDCSFGLLGAIPLWICRRETRRLEQILAQQGTGDLRSS
jgi:hypothetical protein